MIDIQILHKKWKVSVIEADSFKRRFGSDEAAAYTIPAAHEIVFDQDELSLELVIHELVHAYYAGLCIGSANLHNEQVEEIHAELFASHGIMIIKQAKALLKEMRSL